MCIIKAYDAMIAEYKKGEKKKTIVNGDYFSDI